MEVSTPLPAHFISGKENWYLFTEGWMDPKAGLDGYKKNLASSGFDPRIAQSVTSRYSDGVILAHTQYL